MQAPLTPSQIEDLKEIELSVSARGSPFETHRSEWQGRFHLLYSRGYITWKKMLGMGSGSMRQVELTERGQAVLTQRKDARGG